MIKIWHRYFIKEVLKVFFLILFCFFGLYVLIDYASHSRSLFSHHSAHPWKDLFLFYSFEIIQRLDVCVPFALLIATIRTLIFLRSQNELTALLTSGIALHRLLGPFVLLGLAFTALIYLNTELFVPAALTELRHIHDKRANLKSQKNKNIVTKHVALKDNTSLLFQSYDEENKMFFDAYWIKSADEIYRIKFLYPYTEIPTGEFVDHFTRKPSGEVTKSGSYEKRLMPELRFNKKVLLDTLTAPEELSLTSLWKKHQENGDKMMGEKEASLAAVLFRKLAIPWFCLLAVIGPAPFCIRFCRDQSTFFIYAISIFALVACFLIIDAAWVLAERQVFPPAWALGIPFACMMSFPVAKFILVR